MGADYCGVPQCKNHRSESVSLHRLPRKVLKNKSLKKLWMIQLRMGKEFPKYFKICSEHFEDRYLLSLLKPTGDLSKKQKVLLSDKAFPTENLPKFDVAIKSPKCHQIRKSQSIKKSHLEESSPMLVEANTNLEEDCSKTSVAVQCLLATTTDKIVQTDMNQFRITSLWNTEQKLKVMTGIPSFEVLDKMVQMCENVENEQHFMSMRDRILLTMHKLKSNASFAELAVNFESVLSTVKTYIFETIQLLAKVLGGLIYWTTLQQNLKSLPKCTNITSVRVPVDNRIGRIKNFKVLADKVPVSLLPYIDDVFTVIAAVSNLEDPLLSDDWYL